MGWCLWTHEILFIKKEHVPEDVNSRLFLSVNHAWAKWNKSANKLTSVEPMWYIKQNMGKTMIDKAVKPIHTSLTLKFLRKYCATTLLELGIDREHVAHLTGHADPQNLRHYKQNSSKWHTGPPTDYQHFSRW